MGGADSSSCGVGGGGGGGASFHKAAMEFTEDDYDDIREIADVGESLFKLLVHSLCPSIYGHEMVKAGLLLGLFGGEQKKKNYLLSHFPVC